MKVQVYKIPKEGMAVQFDVPPDFLRQSLQEGDEVAAYLQQAAAVEGQLTLTGPGEVLVRLAVRAKLRPNCYRCTAEYGLPVDFRVEMIYLPPGAAPKGKQGQDYEDLNTGFYENDEIDLDVVVREQLFLALPMSFICQDDCRGLCGRCGANLNLQACSCSIQAGRESPFAQLKSQMKS